MSSQGANPLGTHKKNKERTSCIEIHIFTDGLYLHLFYIFYYEVSWRSDVTFGGRMAVGISTLNNYSQDKLTQF